MQRYTFGNIEVTFSAAENILYMTWHGFAKTPDYKEACEKILEVTVPHKAYKFLYDQRKMGVMKNEDVEWTTNSFYPRYYAAVGRHQKSAVVVSESIFGEMAVKKIVNGLDKIETEDSLQNKFFSDTEEAKKWLLDSSSVVA